MIPIHRLLARLRWDPAFAAGRVTIGYLDRMDRSIHQVALQDLRPDPDNPSLLELEDEDGVVHDIPLHRIREVRRNGELIWQRPPPLTRPPAVRR